MAPITKEKWREIMTTIEDPYIDRKNFFGRCKEILARDHSETYTSWENDNFDENYLFELKDKFIVCKRSLFSIAVENGLIGTVKCLIGTVDVNEADNKGWTPLSYAVKGNYEEMTKLLLHHGADLTIHDTNKMTPLHGACVMGNLNMIKLLCQETNSEKIPSNEPNPALIAAVKGHLEVVKYFIDSKLFTDVDALLVKAAESGNILLVKYLVEEKSANVVYVDKNNNSPAVYAAKKGNYNIVRYFVEKDDNVLTLTDGKGGTLIFPAAVGGNVEILKYLIEEKKLNFMSSLNGHWTDILLKSKGLLPLDMYGRYGREDFTIQELSVLHLAAAFGRLEVVKYLIERVRIDENICDFEGIVPLHLAAANGQLSVVKYLVETKTVEPDFASNAGLTALHLACDWGQIDVVKYLMLEHGVSVNLPDSKYWTPLHFAASGGNLDLVEYLLNKNADLNAKNTKGRTPLHLAARENHKDLVRYLIEEANADMTIIDEDFTTPFYLAAQKGHLDLVKYFVEDLKVNFIDPDVNGWTALYATTVGSICDFDVIRYLVEKGADVNALTITPYKNRTPLQGACFRGNLEVVKYLIEEKHASLSSVDENGHTPVVPPIENGHFEVAKYLIETHNCDVNVVDIGKRTVLHLAAHSGHFDMFVYLFENFDHVRRHIDTRRTDNEWTPLYEAVAKGYYAIAKFIVEKGANVNLADNHGNTPLHKACMRGDLNVVELLVENRADISRLNKYRHSALNKAMKHGHEHVCEYFKQLRYRTKRW